MIFTKTKISAYFITIGDITDSTFMHIECVRCHAIKNKIENDAVDKVEKL